MNKLFSSYSSVDLTDTDSNAKLINDLSVSIDNLKLLQHTQLSASTGVDGDDGGNIAEDNTAASPFVSNNENFNSLQDIFLNKLLFINNLINETESIISQNSLELDSIFYNLIKLINKIEDFKTTIVQNDILLSSTSNNLTDNTFHTIDNTAENKESNNENNSSLNVSNLSNLPLKNISSSSLNDLNIPGSFLTAFPANTTKTIKKVLSSSSLLIANSNSNSNKDTEEINNQLISTLSQKLESFKFWNVLLSNLSSLIHTSLSNFKSLFNKFISLNFNHLSISINQTIFDNNNILNINDYLSILSQNSSNISSLIHFISQNHIQQNLPQNDLSFLQFFSQNFLNLNNLILSKIFQNTHLLIFNKSPNNSKFSINLIKIHHNHTKKKKKSTNNSSIDSIFNSQIYSLINYSLFFNSLPIYFKDQLIKKNSLLLNNFFQKIINLNLYNKLSLFYKISSTDNYNNYKNTLKSLSLSSFDINKENKIKLDLIVLLKLIYLLSFLNIINKNNYHFLNFYYLNLKNNILNINSSHNPSHNSSRNSISPRNSINNSIIQLSPSKTSKKDLLNINKFILNLIELFKKNCNLPDSFFHPNPPSSSSSSSSPITDSFDDNSISNPPSFEAEIEIEIQSKNIKNTESEELLIIGSHDLKLWQDNMENLKNFFLIDKILSKKLNQIKNYATDFNHSKIYYVFNEKNLILRSQEKKSTNKLSNHNKFQSFNENTLNALISGASTSTINLTENTNSNSNSSSNSKSNSTQPKSRQTQNSLLADVIPEEGFLNNDQVCLTRRLTQRFSKNPNTKFSARMSKNISKQLSKRFSVQNNENEWKWEDNFDNWIEDQDLDINVDNDDDPWGSEIDLNLDLDENSENHSKNSKSSKNSIINKRSQPSLTHKRSEGLLNDDNISLSSAEINDWGWGDEDLDDNLSINFDDSESSTKIKPDSKSDVIKSKKSFNTIKKPDVKNENESLQSDSLDNFENYDEDSYKTTLIPDEIIKIINSFINYFQNYRIINNYNRNLIINKTNELLQLFYVIFVSKYEDEIFFYNDCYYLNNSIKKSNNFNIDPDSYQSYSNRSSYSSEGSITSGAFDDTIEYLLQGIKLKQERSLFKIFNKFNSFDSLNDSNLTDLILNQLEFKFQEIFNDFKSFSKRLRDVLLKELFDLFYSKIINCILKRNTITEVECEELNRIITVCLSYIENYKNFYNFGNKNIVILESFKKTVGNHHRLENFKLIISSHLDVIMENFYNGEFYDLKTFELVHLILAAFSNSEIRKHAISEIEDIRSS
ncbi:uncharacterized protein ASCRUDRAFT_9821 [Ascoidea rubescens DSM 1968]|uniref:Retrograde transport protein Dsl1 C-terminal domain-containing protein n=1 Tax=Ascoidea rubescens DSM 1968 TaxID=1344418 RepID=A0A1D2VBT8_9ASCO|nr:hypothetical protein ASCRUDRAFT_9821 [Ascoidea rubescens DSM 1968]ODV59075.1 hypothetical protein ASCRUDRAFT_9821 [Ascoidea rubescens DSM 1968]